MHARAGLKSVQTTRRSTGRCHVGPKDPCARRFLRSEDGGNTKARSSRHSRARAPRQVILTGLTSYFFALLILEYVSKPVMIGADHGLSEKSAQGGPCRSSTWTLFVRVDPGM